MVQVDQEVNLETEETLVPQVPLDPQVQEVKLGQLDPQGQQENLVDLVRVDRGDPLVREAKLASLVCLGKLVLEEILATQVLLVQQGQPGQEDPLETQDQQVCQALDQVGIEEIKGNRDHLVKLVKGERLDPQDQLVPLVQLVLLVLQDHLDEVESVETLVKVELQVRAIE